MKKLIIFLSIFIFNFAFISIQNSFSLANSEIERVGINNGSSINNSVEPTKITEHRPLLAILNSGIHEGQDYSPDPLIVTRGEVINITNTDIVVHTVTEGYDENAISKVLFNSGVLLAGKNTTIDTKNLVIGEYPYHCMIHPFMKGLLVVT